MFTVKKTLTISSAHYLPEYPGKCRRLHGHNWRITATCQSKELDEQGMVVDFAEIKRLCERLDHYNINDVFAEVGHKVPTTAENIAEFLCYAIPKCVKLEVEENDGSVAIFERED